MPRADDLIFRIGANAAGFLGAMNGVQKTARTAGASVTSAFGGADRAMAAALRSTTALAAGLGLLGGGLSLAAIRQVVDEVGSIADVAGRVAMTTDEVQELRFALEQTGGTAQEADAAMEGFARRIAEVAAGADNDLARVLRANNVALTDQAGNLRSQGAILRDYAELVRRAGSEQDRTRLAALAFGNAGVGLVNTLREGSDGLDRMRQRAHELGTVIGGDTISAAQELDTKFKEVIAGLDTRWKKFVVAVAQNADWLYGRITGLGQSFGALAVHGRDLDELAQTAADTQALIADLEASGGSVLNMTTRAMGAALADPLASIDDLIVKARSRLGEIRAEQDRLFREASAGSLTGMPKPGENRTTIPNREDEEARKRAAAAAERQAAKVREVTEALVREWQALGQNNEQKRIAAELARAGVDAKSAEGRAIADMVRIIEAEQRTIEGLSARMEDFNARQMAAREGWEYLGGSAESALLSIVDNSASAEDALKRLAVQLAIAAAKAALLGQGPLAGLFGPATLPGGSISPLVAAMAAAGKGGLFAKGGVADRPSIFGEAGPEAAVPLPDGRRIPVDLRGSGQSGQAGGGQSSILVELSPELKAAILEEAAGQSVQIVQKVGPGVARNAIKSAHRAGADF